MPQSSDKLPVIRCEQCQKRHGSQATLTRHLAQSKVCAAFYYNEAGRRATGLSTPFEQEHQLTAQADGDAMDVDGYAMNVDNDEIADYPGYIPPPRQNPESTPPSLAYAEASAQRQRVTIEEIEDPESHKPIKRTPRSVADILGMGKTAFEEIRDAQIKSGAHPWEPFADEEEWGLARWLMKNVNQGATDEFLKLPIVGP
jgi:hypothetical protein